MVPWKPKEILGEVLLPVCVVIVHGSGTGRTAWGRAALGHLKTALHARKLLFTWPIMRKGVWEEALKRKLESISFPACSWFSICNHCKLSYLFSSLRLPSTHSLLHSPQITYFNSPLAETKATSASSHHSFKMEMLLKVLGLRTLFHSSIIEDSKEHLYLGMICIDIYCIKNYNWET